MDNDRAAKAALVFAEGLRALDMQERTLDSVRTRMGVFFSAGFIIAGLAANVLKGGVELGWLGVAIGALGVLLAAMAVVVWPREWSGLNQPEQLAGKWIDAGGSHAGGSVADLHRELVTCAQCDLAENRRPLARVRVALFVGVLALAVEAGAFALAA